MSNMTNLRDAVANGNKEKILEILQQGAVNLKATDDAGDTLLHLAFTNAELGEAQLIEILEILLDRGLDIKAVNHLGKAILHLAVERCMRDVVDLCLRRNAIRILRNPASITYHHQRSHTIAHFVVEEECRKFHSFINDDTIEDLEPLKDESSSFVACMVSRRIDFLYAKNTQDVSALYLAMELNLQHVLLALLKSVTETDLFHVVHGKTHLLHGFILRNAHPDQYGYRYHSPEPMPSSLYANRHTREIVKLILKKIRHITDETMVATLTAVIRGDDEDRSIVQMLAKRVYRAHCGGSYGGLMHTFSMRFYEYTDPASIKYGLGILRTLVNKRADVNERDYNGDTHAQSMFRAHPSWQLLKILEKRTDFGARADNGQNFLHIIGQHCDDARMVDLVVDRGCRDLEAKDDNGETPLRVALIFRHELVALRMIERGANPKDEYDNGRSPLSFACMNGLARATEKLIGLGGDLGYKHRMYGLSLLHMAAKRPQTANPKVVELLIKSGLDVHARDNEGKTPLHRAKTASVVRLLVETGGAQLQMLDNRGYSPLSRAIIGWIPETIAELLKYGADMRGPKELECAMYQFQKTSDRIEESNYAKRHLVKLAAVRLLDKKCLEPRVNEPVWKEFFEQCRAEVERLKAFFIDDRMTLYNLLRASRKHRCDYVEAEKLKAFVDDGESEREFPNYFVLILGCYNDAKKRKPLMEPLVGVVNKLSKTRLPDLCSEKIFKH